MTRIGKLLPSAAVIFAHISGVSLSLGYGVYHILFDYPSIGIFSILGSFFGILSLLAYKSNKRNSHHLAIYMIFLGCALLLTSYFFGYRGLILLFPFTASLFYLIEYKYAVTGAILFTVTCLFAALNVTELSSIIRYTFALFISVGFSICYAYVMNAQKERLEKDAHYDALTGITNRRQFNYWLNSVIEDTTENKKIALFYIDIDDFKHVNDSYGHAEGDELLKKFSERILKVIRHSELIMATHKIYNFARLAGDEFVIAILDLDEVNGAKKIAERLIESTSQPFELATSVLKIHISVGIVYSEASISAEMLLHNADSSMYRAKQNGKNTYYLFDETISNEINRRKDIEKHITHTLENDLFSLAYMPIYNIKENPSIVGVEALLRCDEEYFDGEGPEKFIPIAEATGQIKDIDLWVMEKVFQDISKVKHHPATKDLWFAINISSTELLDSSFIDIIENLLSKYEINPKTIHLEITETKLVPYENVIIDRMNRLKELNFHLSLDDYGTGYTGFAQLLNFPGDYIKIDRSFINEIGNGDSNYTKMIGVMFSIAQIYGLKVIAEGVETNLQMDFLDNFGCEFAQGFYFSEPVPLENFVELVNNQPTKLPKLSSR